AWPIGEKVIDKTDSTKQNAFFSTLNPQLLNPKPSTPQLSAGWYKIIATTKDKYGEEVKAEKYIELTSNKKQTILNPISIDITKGKAEPGEQLQYNIKTGFDKVWLIKTDSR